MSDLTTMAEELDALRAEIDGLDGSKEPLTDEQVARFDAALVEWDSKKSAYDAAVERAEKIEAIRAASLDARNVTPAFGAGVNVRVKSDPFEDLDGLRFVNPNSDDVVARAVTAISETRMRGVTDKAIEGAVRTIETVPGAAVHALAHGSRAYMSAFQEYMRTQGRPNYSPEQADAVRTAMSLTSATGGYALPTLLDETLIKTGTAVAGSIRAISRVETGTQNVWHGVSTGNVTTYWKGEGSAFTDGSPTLAGPSVTAALLSAYIPGSYEIFEDTSLLAQLPGLIGEAFMFAEEAAFVVGSGSTAPKGVITAVSGTAGSLVTCTTRGSFTTASAVDVFAVVNAVAARNEDSSTWVANKAIYNVIAQMSTGSQGSYFWTDFNTGQRGRGPLLGSPTVAHSSVPTAQTSGTIIAILGDFSQFIVYDRIGTSVEFIANVVDGSGLPTGQRALVAHKRVGSDVTDVGAFRLLKT